MIPAMKLPLLALGFFASVQIAFSSNDLPRSTPEAEGISSQAVLNMIEAFERDVDAVHGFMLLRHGAVVAEGWWDPYSSEYQHVLYSLTKSYNSSAIGIAQDEGLLSVDDRVLSFFPNEAPAEPSNNMKQMRIRDLLTMSTGHVDDTMGRLRVNEKGEWVKAFLATDPEFRPGIHFRYNSGASYMLSAIVQKVTGQMVVDYLETRLFEPLGIEEAFWGQSPEGINLGGGGMKVYLKDAAHLGQLYLQKGMWNGKRILSEAWVEAASDRQASSGSGAGGNWNHGYGYQFWRNKGMGYRADGAMGQFSLILPELNIVLAINSGTTNTNGVMEAVWENLLPGVSDGALKVDGKSRDALFDKLGSLRLPTQEGDASSSMAKKVSGEKYVFAENDQGVNSVQVEFSGNQPVVTIMDTTGEHIFHPEYGEWDVAPSDFRPRISTLFDDPGQRIATSGAWTSKSAFTMKIYFAETPYMTTLKLTFDDDKLLFDMSHNGRWDGPTTRPQLVGVSKR